MLQICSYFDLTSGKEGMGIISCVETISWSVCQFFFNMLSWRIKSMPFLLNLFAG